MAIAGQAAGWLTAATNLCRVRYCTAFGWISKYCLSVAKQYRGDNMAVQMTKSQLIEKIAAETEVAKKDVKGVLETLATVGYKELKKAGVFLVPGFAKFVVIKKPATKARQGTNPFNGEPMMFKAKPARKIVRARPVKAAKDSV
jgi:DNA-binding protein HU-beta